MEDHVCDSIDFLTLRLTPAEAAQLVADRAEIDAQNAEREKYAFGEGAFEVETILTSMYHGLRLTTDEIVRDETAGGVENTLVKVRNLVDAIDSLYAQRRRTAYNLPLLVVA